MADSGKKVPYFNFETKFRLIDKALLSHTLRLFCQRFLPSSPASEKRMARFVFAFLLLYTDVLERLTGVLKGKWKSKLLIKDAIADIALQQVLTRPEGVRPSSS